MSGLQNRLRRWLGVRRPRALPRRGPKPAIGSLAANGELRLTVQAGLSDELWIWLLEEGWRELTYRPDRRRYRELPGGWVTRLIDVEPELRSQVLRLACERAVLRPVLGNPETLPSYLSRR